MRRIVEEAVLAGIPSIVIDPGDLFGIPAGAPARTRVSVVSLVGLPSLERQQLFVNRLAMRLFTWVKEHPGAAGGGMTGLLVLDEAKDFLPTVRTTPCKLNLLRLAAWARKYGLGLVSATQNPVDMDSVRAAPASAVLGRRWAQA